MLRDETRTGRRGFPDMVRRPWARPAALGLAVLLAGCTQVGPSSAPSVPARQDAVPTLTVADASASEDAGTLPFMVTLSAPAGEPVVVSYATEDGTAVAGDDYRAARDTLTVAAGATTATITVPLVNDSVAEDQESFTLKLTMAASPAASVGAGPATGTIEDDDSSAPPASPADPADAPTEPPGAPPTSGAAPPGLASLQVTGGGTMYPRFETDVHHYALPCTSVSNTLRVRAQAHRRGTRLTLLRADAADNHAASDALDVSLAVNRNQDIAIRLGDADGAITYVVHCLPTAFPRIDVLRAAQSGVGDGLLLVTPRLGRESNTFLAIIDDNGVPRFHERLSPRAGGGTDRPGRGQTGYNLRRQPGGLFSLNRDTYVELYDARLRYLRTVYPQPPLPLADFHDFLITNDGNYLFIGYLTATRDLCTVTACEPGTEKLDWLIDSWIQEVTPAGDKVFEWNSWDHLKLTDCSLGDSDYAHLNSLQLVDGDIIATFRRCNTVARIDRSTGALEWQVGGTSPPRDDATDYLTIVDDSDGQNEFCGPHSATLTESGTLLLYDNGNFCNGPRKQASPFSRVVEYDLVITDTRKEAVFKRQYLLPSGHGYSASGGSVVELPNGNWVIGWGYLEGASAAYDRRFTMSEVDPDTGTSLLDISMYSVEDGVHGSTYRVYRETGIRIPLNLP